MGLKKISQNIWKIICSSVFTIVFILGLLMCLSAYGVGIKQDAFGAADHLQSQKFISFLLMIIGLFLGILPFFKIFKTLIKFVFSIIGVLFFAYGICVTLDAYDVAQLAWASVNNGTAWGPIIIVIGLFTGVIPFFKTWKKLFCNDKKDKASE